MSWGPNARMMYRARKLAMREARRREQAYTAHGSGRPSPQPPTMPTVDVADRAETAARWQCSAAFIAAFCAVMVNGIWRVSPAWIFLTGAWFVASLNYFGQCRARLADAHAHAACSPAPQPSDALRSAPQPSMASVGPGPPISPMSKPTALPSKPTALPKRRVSQQEWDNRLREESRWRKAARNGELDE